MNYNLIKRGVLLPEDFVIDGVLNREKYIIEYGFPDTDKWYDEHKCIVSAEVIGAIVIGSDAYTDFRWRLRLETDQKFDLSKTAAGIISNAGMASAWGTCCGNEGEKTLHTCPFAEDILGDSKTLCNCCLECTYECLMDI